MKKTMKLFLLVFTGSMLMINEVDAQQRSECRQVIDEMMEAIGKIKTLRYTLAQNERVDGKLGSARQDVKVAFNPFKLYIYNYEPNDGAEVLYIEGENDGDALVNPGSFPYINLNLDPNGSILRRGQHHSMCESGFNYLKSIIQFAIDTAGNDFDKYFKLEGTATIDGKACHKVVITFDDFKYVDYKVKKGESVLDIAKERMISEYMIVRENDKVDDYEDVKEGQVIKVPIVYAKVSVLYIEKMRHLPIKQEMSDDKGLYERYAVTNLRVNTTISDEEFDEDYKDYDF
ncbi:MAG: DUF1571 domain-containing protein [Flavobacteriales bacterium]|nr:DUF1571 domain-containing protein [Flavobacteriales bacterium]